jgi:hypothetical protein
MNPRSSMTTLRPLGVAAPWILGGALVAAGVVIAPRLIVGCSLAALPLAVAASARCRSLAPATVLLSVALLGYGVLCTLLSPVIESEDRRVAGLPQGDAASTFFIYLVAAAGAAIPALVAGVLARADPRPHSVGNKDDLRERVRRSAPLGAFLLLPAALSCILLAVGAGSLLWARATYIPLVWPSDALVRFASLLLSPSLALAFVVMIVTQHMLVRVCAAVLSIGLTAILFSLATRELAILPVVLVGGLYFAGKIGNGSTSTLRLLTLITVCAIATLALMGLALQLRGLPRNEHGLRPYSAWLLEHPTQAIGLNGADSILSGLLNGYRVTSYLSSQSSREISLPDLVLSGDPRPGGNAVAREVDDRFLLGELMPSSSLGMASTSGILAVYLLGGMIGTCLCLPTLLNPVGTRLGEIVRALTLIVTPLLFIYLVQYQLRNSMRVATSIALLGTLVSLTRIRNDSKDQHRILMTPPAERLQKPRRV